MKGGLLGSGRGFGGTKDLGKLFGESYYVLTGGVGRGAGVKCVE
jgi:hypothetical protein